MNAIQILIDNVGSLTFTWKKINSWLAHIFADFSIYWWLYDPVFCVFLKKTNSKTLGASVTLAAVVIPTKGGVGVKDRKFWRWLWCGSF